jgi:hypothetical protein
VIEDIDPVQCAGQQAVVALPVHMDASNAGQIREELLSAINGGATVLIADMTASPPAEALAVVAGPGLGGSRSWGGSTVGYGR